MTDATMGPFIDNGRTQGSAGQYEPIDPTTEKPLGTVQLAGNAEIDAAVDAARRALDEGPWGRTLPGERAVILHAFADALDARSTATAELVTRENGMPIGLSEAVNGFVPAFLLRTYADLVAGTDIEQRRGGTIVRREPVGVVAAIAPWNFPQALGMIKVAPALAAGCTVVLKPAPETSLDAIAIAEAARDAGLPPGVLNIVPADRDAGAYLVGHAGVDKVAFTGSTAAGRTIGETCGRLIRRTTFGTRRQVGVDCSRRRRSGRVHRRSRQFGFPGFWHRGPVTTRSSTPSRTTPAMSSSAIRWIDRWRVARWPPARTVTG